MKLTVSRYKNSATYYIQKFYRTEFGKNSTKTFEHLGSMKEFEAHFGEEDTRAKVKEYVGDLSTAEKESRHKALVRLFPSILLTKDEQRCSNGGCLFLQTVIS